MQGSRTKDAIVFVGPAQTGKTDALIINGILHNVRVDPLDMIVYCPTQTAARMFSMQRVDRLHRHSPEVGDQLLKRRDADNKFDKIYKSGVILALSYPTVTELAGRPVPRIWLTDYDRMPQDVDGEGAPFDLARKRTTTFQSFAMCVAESSPSFPVIDPRKWISKSAHEAPPCQGILGLYNRGDRRRWYWPCPACDEYFEGRWEHLHWDELPNGNDAADTVHMICPHCAARIDPDERYDMNTWGAWLADGQRMERHPKWGHIIVGDAPRAEIASFWLRGPAAAFQTWRKLVVTFIEATNEFLRTGTEEALKKFFNNDLAEPYTPKSLDNGRLPEVLKTRSEDIGGTSDAPEVASDVRTLIAAVDVQQNAFVTQVLGLTPGSPFDVVLVDRFVIQKSKRLDQDGERHWVKPGTYQEDWDLIEQQVMSKSYPLSDGSGRHMLVRFTVCDSGGKEGVTTNAYDFYRKLRRQNKHAKFMLVKGEPSATAPRTQVRFPDSNRKDKLAVARGDVPVLFINSNMIKDVLSNRLDCTTPGAGMYRMPSWLPDWFFAELCAETRDEKGWTNPSHTRNEAWDLSYYILGLCLSQILRVDGIDWERPPSWALPWDSNSLVTESGLTSRYTGVALADVDFRALGKALA